MENADFVGIFQHLAYPVAVSVVLFFAFGWVSKKVLEDGKKRDEELIKLRDHFIGYLQQEHIELSGAILENAAASKENASAMKENATAMKEMASAMNRFALILERLEKKLGICKNDE